MNSFVYEIPTKVYFGANQLEHLSTEIAQCAKRVLLTYGGGSIKQNGLYDRVLAEIEKAGATCFELCGIEPNPRIDSVRKGAELCKKENIELIVAVGGGSVLDCSKFIAAATFYDGDPWDIVQGKVGVQNCLPLFTIPTLAATGSEMNAGGVISNLETKEKLFGYFPPMLPKVSFLDPANTYTVNRFQTACAGVDILSHTLEVYFHQDKDLELLDNMMEGLMKIVLKYTPIALEDPANEEARANLMWASSWALNGFFNGGKNQGWSCHPIEHELSAFYDITHGLGLAILTPNWMRYILKEDTLSRFYRFGTHVLGIDPNLPKQDVAEKSIEMLNDFFFQVCGLDSTLGAIGIDETHFDEMACRAEQNGTLAAYRPLNKAAIHEILTMCL